MARIIKCRVLLLLVMCVAAWAGAGAGNTNLKHDLAVEDKNDALVVLHTTMGDITVELFNDTPLHRDNFLKLVKDGFYDGVLFHRVINDFMVQTGDPKSKSAAKGAELGEGDPGYTIEAEIEYPKHFHKYGALAAARTADQFNPERRSSGSQFYIVTGQKQSAQRLDAMQRNANHRRMEDYFQKLVAEHADSIKKMRLERDSAGLENLRLELARQTEEAVKPDTLPAEIREAYTTVGGTPHLDGAYTVFGQVVDGMDVVEKIQKAETDPSDRPVDDIRILKAEVVADLPKESKK